MYCKNFAALKKIVDENGRVSYVELADGTRKYAGIFVSNMHPVKTLEMTESPLLKNGDLELVIDFPSCGAPLVTKIIRIGTLCFQY